MSLSILERSFLPDNIRIEESKSIVKTVQSADDVIMYSTWRGRCVVLLCLGAVWDLRERDHTPHTQHGTTSKEECTTLFLWCVVVLHTEIGDGPFPCYLHATMLQCYAWKVKAFLSICW